MPKLFTRKIENFTCFHCGKEVEGNGYTDHCPFCLWSKHVDVNPGDRMNYCRGEMEPVGVEAKKIGYIIHYQCLKCKEKHQVRSVRDDDENEILKLPGYVALSPAP